jgi:hypothetical protein
MPYAIQSRHYLVWLCIFFHQEYVWNMTSTISAYNNKITRVWFYIYPMPQKLPKNFLVLEFHTPSSTR